MGGEVPKGGGLCVLLGGRTVYTPEEASWPHISRIHMFRSCSILALFVGPRN